MAQITEKNKHVILFVLMMLTTIPFIFIVNTPSNWSLDTAGLKGIALYGASVAGYIGLSLMLWQFILGTRSVSGLFFKDLPWITRLHVQLGIWGTLLIFVHPLLIMYAYGEDLLYTFVPNLSPEFEKYATLGRFAIIALLMVWVTSAIIKGKIAYRPWKYIHYLVYLALPLSLLHARMIGSSFDDPIVQVYWYIFVLVFLIFIVLRLRFVFGYGKVTYEVISQKELAEDIYLIKLKTTEKSIHINMGQYVYLQPNLLSEDHPFTVLRFDAENDEFEVAYKVFGKFTKKLPEITAGNSMLVDGAYGIFTEELNKNPELPSVFIAGGIGITPFVSHVLDSASDADQVLFYANRTKDSGVFRSELKKKLGDKYIDVLSRDKSKASASDERGYISEVLINKYVDKPERYNYFICGPQGMMDASKTAIESLGVPKEQIHAEEFGF